MADVTYLPNELFIEMIKEAVTVAGIKYAPINYLRMNMYWELSHPNGDVSRWEKVLKRLTLLNTHHPFKTEYNCMTVDFQRKMDTGQNSSEELYSLVRKTFIELDVIFFGGYASSLYSQYMPEKQRKIMEKIPDFDVISEEPEKTAMIICERLTESGFKNAKSIIHEPIYERMGLHIEIRVGKETVAFIYKPLACHSYNKIKIDGDEINIATIDTMLAFYLAFYYINKPYYPRDRILCMSKFLFEVEQNNRLEQKGILKRFSISCYGTQLSLSEMRNEKTLKFKELSDKKGTREYNMWFLKYNPAEKSKFYNVDTSNKFLKKNKYNKTYKKRYRPNYKKNYKKKSYRKKNYRKSGFLF
jgi:hypothetical protein